MRLNRFALVAALALAALGATASADVQPAVQPGGDIPQKFVPPIPRGGDIPQKFTPPRREFQYIRREAMILMRDGVRLYVVLIIPRSPAYMPSPAGPERYPIMLD